MQCLFKIKKVALYVNEQQIIDFKKRNWRSFFSLAYFAIVVQRTAHVWFIHLPRTVLALYPKNNDSELEILNFHLIKILCFRSLEKEQFGDCVVLLRQPPWSFPPRRAFLFIIIFAHHEFLYISRQ